MGTSAGTASRLTAAGLLIAALAGGAVGCTDNDGRAAEPPTASAPPKSDAAASQAADSTGETITEAPAPFSGRAVIQVASRAGNAVLPLKPTDAGRIGVHISCRGKGPLTVSVAPIGLSFGLSCGDKVTGQYNEFHTNEASAKEGAIRITAPTTARWALTVEQ
ncbi:hypothetical protein V1460_01375 [Streptomyces sp. SCSIO 30461]|uniref:hypothetical protein n=1 Tax=Streptomyces sp. SCSIO 30461 TaxID=3118085 RepID=UPI0030D11A73